MNPPPPVYYIAIMGKTGHLFAYAAEDKARPSGHLFDTRISAAKKFGTVADAALWAEEHGFDPVDAEGFAEGWTVLGVLPSVLVQAEAREQHDWNHRDCQNGRAA